MTPKTLRFTRASLLDMPTTLGVSANADPSQWHGAFDCAQCQRTSLPAMEFSAKMQQKRRADANAKVKCKRCVASAEDAERALSRAAAAMRIADDDGTTYLCSVCKVEKPSSGFSRAQLNSKSPDARRCSTCRDAEAANASASASAKVHTALADARAASVKAEATNAPDKLAVFAREAALEAELVTGLKPKKIAGGRGRGRGRGANPNSMLGRGGRK